ncbi:glycosyltransferase [Marinobacter sp.]|uniref:glycosyltransferase n=1 Tax=Marinobacter sp. TaxID=50741 RepID=UPI002B26AB22|nr:glycosyltransferase [Marinobacter sp.]
MNIIGERSIPRISVIVPAKNEEKYIGDCIRSLKCQSYPSSQIEIIVVDNNSTDQTALIAEDMGVRVIHTEAERIGQVRNAGVEDSKGDFLFFIDADCVASPSWIAKCLDLLSKHNKVGAIGGEALVRNQASKIEKFWVVSDAAKKTTMKYLNGSSMAFTREVFFKVGGFKEDINAGEDSFFANSLRELGLKIVHDSSADVIHLGYPRTIVDFFKTQFWHSSSYLRSNLGFSEYMFWFTLLSLFSIGSMAYAIFSKEIILTFVSIIMFSVGPMLFYFKKLINTETKLNSSEGLVLLFLCFVYFLARVLGLFYSLTGISYYRKKVNMNKK